MSLLATVWPKGDPTIRRPIGAGGRQELLRAISMLAMASADLRSPISGLVTCSDASETGGGICCSGSLSGEGLRVLESLQTPLYKKTRCAVFAPQGALTVSNDQGPRVMVVSLFDGIGAVMCGLSRLRCRIVAYALSEIDKPCRRLVRKRWPGVIELGDATKITDEALETLWRSVCFQVDLVSAGEAVPARTYQFCWQTGKGWKGAVASCFLTCRVFSKRSNPSAVVLFSPLWRMSSLCQKIIGINLQWNWATNLYCLTAPPLLNAEDQGCSGLTGQLNPGIRKRWCNTTRIGSGGSQTFVKIRTGGLIPFVPIEAHGLCQPSHRLCQGKGLLSSQREWQTPHVRQSHVGELITIGFRCINMRPAT